MPEEARRSSLHWRMWVLVVLGAVAGGGSAAAYLEQGSYLKAALGALLCATCLGVIAWALEALTPPDLHASAAVREARARGGAVGPLVGPASVRPVAVPTGISGGVSTAGSGWVLLNASLTRPSTARGARYESQARSSERVVE
jgi:hypothetical protein